MATRTWLRRMQNALRIARMDGALTPEEILALRRMRHDLINHFQTISLLAGCGQCQQIKAYVSELAQQVPRKVDTGCLAADAVLSAKLAKCESSGVRLQYSFTLPQLSRFAASDVTAILGNLLDNAIEAAQRVEGRERYVHLSGKCSFNEVRICCVNAAPPPHIQRGRLATVKRGGAHGLGVRQIELRAGRYGGIYHWSYAHGQFEANLTLPLPQEQSPASSLSG